MCFCFLSASCGRFEFVCLAFTSFQKRKARGIAKKCEELKKSDSAQSGTDMWAWCAPEEWIGKNSARAQLKDWLRKRQIAQIPLSVHNQHLSCTNESLRSRVTLREEGQMAGWESPNRLDATAEFQIRRKRSSKSFNYFLPSSSSRVPPTAVPNPDRPLPSDGTSDRPLSHGSNVSSLGRCWPVAPRSRRD
jgi:hypothetical protein